MLQFMNLRFFDQLVYEESIFEDFEDKIQKIRHLDDIMEHLNDQCHNIVGQFGLKRCKKAGIHELQDFVRFFLNLKF